MTKVITKIEEGWYENLIASCLNVIANSVSASRWALIEGYHQLGQRILEESANFERTRIYGDQIVQRVAQSLGKSKRTIWQAIQFYQKYPDLQQLSKGKKITWHKICNNLLPEPKVDPIELPKGKFSVIYADPPWHYPSKIDAKNLYGAASYHYERMPIKDIRAMKVKDILTNNAVLFLWVATGFLEESFGVIKDWGFEYKSNMVWVKEKRRAVFGYYVSGEHELLLIATRGSFLPKTKKLPSSVIKAPTREHSQKPDEAYKIIEYLYPNEKYIELFARTTRKGWAVFGNETNKFDAVSK